MATTERKETAAQPSLAERYVSAVRAAVVKEKSEGKKLIAKTIKLPKVLEAKEYRVLREGIEGIANGETDVKVKVTIVFPLEEGDTAPSSYVIENSVSQKPNVVAAAVKKKVTAVVSDADEDAAFNALNDDRVGEKAAAGDKNSDFTFDEPAPETPAEPAVVDSGESAKLELERIRARDRAARKKPAEPPKRTLIQKLQFWKK